MTDSLFLTDREISVNSNRNYYSWNRQYCRTEDTASKFTVVTRSLLMLLTPTEEGDCDDIASGGMRKNNHQFLEGKEGLCSHPHHGHKSEVMEEG